MARNEEKAQSMLNRFLAAKQDEKRGPKERRPYLATECTDLNEADKWRQQILREIGRKVMEIQNAGLGEHRIRDLNDEINKLVREKGHWERRIVELGGPDYAKTAPKITDSEGNEVLNNRGAGYRYFGAAKQLPGVKELFEKEAPKPAVRSRFQLHKSITPDYYGFRDEEDGVLLAVEAEAEATIQAQALAEWQEKDEERQAALASVTDKALRKQQQQQSGADASGPQFVAYVPLPDQKAIEQMVLEKKKQELLSKYTSEALAKQQQEAKQLLNKQ
eukprot:GHRQ01003561.1.p2 GENE.GHRQ01003561.1~~GHRQ01003561.1.p2  ORF type:complete len:276 (+),score=127.02 GHRQ01003561.1:563-1390(+)